MIRDWGSEADLPDVGFEYITFWFDELGRAKGLGQGIVPLEWGEINAWRDLLQVQLSVWEARMLPMMSRAYVSGYYDGTDPASMPPFNPDDSGFDDMMQRRIENL